MCRRRHRQRHVLCGQWIDRGEELREDTGERGEGRRGPFAALWRCTGFPTLPRQQERGGQRRMTEGGEGVVLRGLHPLRSSLGSCRLPASVC